MVNQYFAHYLLNRGALTPSQMYDALEYERSVRVKLGILAINAGLMTAAQVEEIHALQRTKDKQFGALAVEKGYLNEAQLEALLTDQGKKNLTFLQAVADMGFLSLAELETALEEYLQKNEITREEWISLNHSDAEHLIRGMVDFSAAGERSEFLYGYTGLLLRNIVRFLNDKPMIVVPAQHYAQREDWLVTQNLSGGLNINAGLAMQESVLLEVASRFGCESFKEVSELALDSAGEFINVHHGIFCANLSQDGMELDLHPQSVQKSPGLSSPTYRIPIGTSFGQIDLVLSLLD